MSRESAAAEQFMDQITSAIDQTCRTAQPVSFRINDIDSFYMIQGAPVNRSGDQEIHTLSGDKLEDLGKNRMKLVPGKAVMISLIVNGQQIDGTMQGPPCEISVPAISYRGSDLRIEPLAGVSVLVMASYRGDLESVRRYLDEKVDINGQNQVSALIAAVDGNRTSVVALLLQRGADPNLKADFNGQTALHFAAKRGNLGVVILLLESGAKPDAVDPSGHTPLWGASFQNHPQVIRALVNHGANLQHKDGNGNTAMSIAAAGGGREAIEELSALGLEPDQPNRFGRTPLFDAVDHGKIDALKALLNLGANPNQRTISGNTPLQAAQNNGQTVIIQILRDAGAR
ncbi:MAG: ankyrin repeat domain-containing protein [Leptospiraceae bacterium]